MMMQMADIVKCEEERTNQIEQLRKYQKENVPIVQYGKGEFARQVQAFLAKHQIAVKDSFVDEAYQTDASCLTLDGCISKYGKMAVVICVSNPEVIKRKTTEFRDNPYILDVCFFGHTYPAGEAFLSAQYLKENWERIEAAYDVLADELSKEAMMAFLKAKLSGNNEKYLKEAAAVSGVQYFNSLLKMGEGEIFVDGGAYTGDTYQSFLKQQIPYLKYYAFEPDRSNFAALRRVTDGNDKVKIIEKGIYGSAGSLSFQTNSDMSSKIIFDAKEGGADQVQVTAIDIEAPDATFIKLDIEGAEREGLKGAAGTIRRNKPKLAICCYHKIGDIWELPLYVKELNSEYELYLRQHEGTWTRDLVLYAV